MAITAALVESTPYLLKYLLTAASSSTSASAATAANTVFTFTNAFSATPDLATDSANDRQAQGPNTMQAIMNARRRGYGSIAAGATVTQAQARALLMSRDPSNATLNTQNMMACEMSIEPVFATPANGTNPGLKPPFWMVDASVDASTNPIVKVRLSYPNGTLAAMTGLLTIRVRHSYDF